MLADVVADPGSFFADREPTLGGPFAVVALTVGFSAARRVVPVLAVAEEGAYGSVPAVAVALSTAGSALWTLLALLAYAGAFHLFAGGFANDTPFRATLAVTGWGFVPKLFLAVTGLAVALAAGAGYAPEVGPVGYALVLNGLGAALLGVSAYVWYHGLRAVHGLDAWDAGVAVALPAGVALLLKLFGVAATLLGFGAVGV